MTEEARASIKVEIAGEGYTLRTNADEGYTLRCAALVNDRMEEIQGAGGLDRTKGAILAALSLSDDVLQQRAEAEKLRRSVNRDAHALAERLAKALTGT